jgi:hypothetical protein
MKATLNLPDIFREMLGEKASPSVSISIDDLFTANDLDEEYEIDIDELLEEERVIGHFWGIEDVQEVRTDLDDDQAWEVLQTVKRRLDSNYGINWDVLRYIADDLYPEPDEDEIDAAELKGADL